MPQRTGDRGADDGSRAAAPGTRAAQRETTRARVRQEAAQLFLARGFEATQVRDIATAAGVSVGTVLAEGDKDLLFLSVVETHLTEATLAELAPGRGLRDNLRALSRSMLRDDERKMHLMRDYLGVFLRRGSDPAAAPNRERLAAVVDALTARWAEGLAVAPGSPEAGQHAHEYYSACLGMTFGVASGMVQRDEALRVLDGLADSLTGSLP